MNASTKKVIWFGLTILAFGCIAAVRAQEKSEASAPGSLMALTEEVRQLRHAVEESMRSQTQTQALGVYLSAQQSVPCRWLVGWTWHEGMLTVQPTALKELQQDWQISRIGFLGLRMRKNASLWKKRIDR